MPRKFARALQVLYRDIQAQLVGGSGKEEVLHVIKGLKQGCPISPLLFSLFFDAVEEYIQEKIDSALISNKDLVKMLGLQMIMLLFADDVILMSMEETALSNLFACFEEFC